jgi:VanZ family protein
MSMSWTRKPHVYRLIAALVWVLFIFSFSLQNAQNSSMESQRLAQVLYDLFKNVFTSSPFTLNNFEILVRKTAHVINFTILMMIVIRLTFENIKEWKIGSWLMCLSVAMMDETIQLFVPGRSGQLSDIALDMSGASLILILFILFYERKNHAKTS